MIISNVLINRLYMPLHNPLNGCLLISSVFVIELYVPLMTITIIFVLVCPCYSVHLLLLQQSG